METKVIRTMRTRYGMFALDVTRDEKMARALEGADYPNEEILSVSRACTDAESVVVDIGAHIGTFALPMVRYVKSVIAYEASPETAVLLSRNASLNKLSLRILNKALGAVKGRASLFTRNASNAGANTLVKGGDIPVVPLDSEVERADFIKIDVEGMELEVLAGAERIIQNSRPIILFEVNISQLRAHGVSVARLAHFFSIHEYCLFLPLFRPRAVLALVRSPSLLAALIAPRAWLFRAESAPFDLLAVPKEKSLPLPREGFRSALGFAIGRNLAVKRKRFTAFFHCIF